MMDSAACSTDTLGFKSTFFHQAFVGGGGGVSS